MPLQADGAVVLQAYRAASKWRCKHMVLHSTTAVQLS
jgi:hypothetical protein